MPASRRFPSPAPPLRGDEAAVTPVIGTIFILAITIVGMTTVLLMGAPVIAGLQDQAALRTMTGQFAQVRYDASSLSIEGASKAPGITLPSGSIGIETGDSFVVAVNQDVGNPGGNFALCDFHVSSLEDQATDSQVAVSITGCRVIVAQAVDPGNQNNCGVQLGGFAGRFVPSTANACFQAFRRNQATGGFEEVGTQYNAASTPTVCGVLAPPCYAFDLGQPMDGSDWRFTLTDGRTTALVYAQAYFLHTDQLHWSTASAAGGAEAVFEAGAVFATSKGGQYLEANPAIREAATGDLSGSVDQFYWRIPTLEGNPGGVFSGQDSHSLLLTLDETGLLTQTQAATSLRIDVAGPLAAAWCNSFLLRNDLQTLPKDSTGTRPFQYAEDTLFSCASGDLVSKVRSVTYKTASNDPFAFQLVHARFLASFQL